VFSNEDYVASKNDTFVDYGYGTDPFGHRILVLYKTEEGYDEPDYNDKYIY
jgi:hypothetical protein